MSELFVRFPGTPGNHISTDDVNLLDADTAHAEQDSGVYSLYRLQVPSLVPDAEASFGSNLRELVSNSTAVDTCAFGAIVYNASEAIPVVAGQPYSASARMRADVANPNLSRLNLRLWWFDSSNASISVVSDIVDDADDTFVTLSIANALAPALATQVQLSVRMNDTGVGAGTTIGDTWYVDTMGFAEGSDPTFVPSLRIVGDLDEEKNPTDLPIVFAGDGTPLTIGEGWAGDAYSYIRRDGIGGPIVAQFDPADIVLP